MLRRCGFLCWFDASHWWVWIPGLLYTCTAELEWLWAALEFLRPSEALNPDSVIPLLLINKPPLHSHQPNIFPWAHAGLSKVCFQQDNVTKKEKEKGMHYLSKCIMLFDRRRRGHCLCIMIEIRDAKTKKDCNDKWLIIKSFTLLCLN